MISKLRWNKAWRGLGTPPAQDDDAIVREYARLVSEIEGVRGVWALYIGPKLALATLVEDDKGVERQVYRTELAIYDQWPKAHVRFEVYPDEESLREFVQGATPVLIEA
ncbi:MAG TPA: hypothetical protein VJB57_08285 [Dehalococcoidia bacterium]|nr:hypothetical protein [Dehalococcoidia bacterium]